MHCRPHCRVMDGKIIEFCCFMHTLMPAEPFKSLSVCRTLTMTCPGPLALCDIRLCLDKCIQALSAPNASLCFTHHTYAVTLTHAKRKNHVRAQGTERVELRKKNRGEYKWREWSNVTWRKGGVKTERAMKGERSTVPLQKQNKSPYSHLHPHRFNQMACRDLTRTLGRPLTYGTTSQHLMGERAH